MSERQVIIIGGGPVGAALALDLGLRGVSSVVVESRTSLANIPKGQGLTQRTLEHFYVWGLDEQLRGARLMPAGYPIGEITAYGNLMSQYWHAPAGREVVGDFFFQKQERLPQYRMEAVLRRKLATLPNVDLRLGVTATAVTQANDRVTATVVNESGRNRNAGGGLSGRLRRRPFDGTRGGRHRAQGHRFRSGHDACRLPLARAA